MDSRSVGNREGEASLLDTGTVRVGERRLVADRILIGTGSRTAVPPIEGIASIDWLDHVSALELTELSVHSSACCSCAERRRNRRG